MCSIRRRHWNSATDITRNIRAVCKCIRQAGLKLTDEKGHFGVRQIEFLGRRISPEGVSPQARKIHHFLDKLRFPRSKKALQRYLGFVNYYRNYIPRMAEKLNPFYKVLTNQHYVRFERSIWFSHRSSQWRLPINLETTYSRKTAHVNDGSQLQKCGICPHDWRYSRSESTIKAGNVRPRGVCLKNFLPRATQAVHIRKGFFGNLYGISWVCTHSMGGNRANNCPHRQENRYTFFPNKGKSASTLERMW